MRSDDIKRFLEAVAFVALAVVAAAALWLLLKSAAMDLRLLMTAGQ